MNATRAIKTVLLFAFLASPQLAKLLGLRRVRPAFRYHGNVIGLVGESPRARTVEIGGQPFSRLGRRSVEESEV